MVSKITKEGEEKMIKNQIHAIQFQKRKRREGKKVIRPTISSQRDLKRDRQVLITESRSNSRLLLRDN